MKTIEAIDNIVLGEVKRINRCFIEEALYEWDRIGEGCFALFIDTHIKLRWRDMVSRN